MIWFLFRHQCKTISSEVRSIWEESKAVDRFFPGSKANEFIFFSPSGALGLIILVSSGEHILTQMFFYFDAILLIRAAEAWAWIPSLRSIRLTWSSMWWPRSRCWQSGTARAPRAQSCLLFVGRERHSDGYKMMSSASQRLPRSWQGSIAEVFLGAVRTSLGALWEKNNVQAQLEMLEDEEYE